MKKIKYKEIKELFNKNSLEIISNISDDEIFSSVKTISNASDKDLSFFSNQRYLDRLKIIKAISNSLPEEDLGEFSGNQRE